MISKPSKTLRLLVLILALSQVATSIILMLYKPNFFNTSFTTPVISPAPYAFIIWAPITIGCLVYGIYQILPRTYDKTVYDIVAIQAIITFIGFNLWLFSAVRKWETLTVIIIIAMSVALYYSFISINNAYKNEKLNNFEKIFTYWTFGIYFGWTTLATFINIAAAIKSYGVTDRGFTGVLWQSIVLVLAAITVYYILFRIEFSLPYYAAVMWGFFAIVVTLLGKSREFVPLLVIAGIATIVLAVIPITQMLRRNQLKYS